MAEEAPEVTIEQRKALNTLERAFMACAKVGLCFYGMDDSITAFDEQEMEEIDYDMDTRCEHQGVYVNDHGTYRDSGGW